MSLETQVQAVLSPVASGGAHQDIARQGVVAPYLVWTLALPAVNATLTGASDVQNARLTVQCFARTPALRRALADAVTAVMAAASFTNLPMAMQNHYEAETQLFVATLEFSVWSVL